MSRENAAIFGGARLPNGQIVVAECLACPANFRYYAVKPAEPCLSRATARRIYSPFSRILQR